MILVWLKFFVLLVLIYIFGVKASKCADRIADRKGWSKAFMGVIFISMITSFPELFTGISAVIIVDSADMAIGEILGSCMFNLLIIGMIDIFFYRNPLSKLKNSQNISPIVFGSVLIGIMSLFILTNLDIGILNIGLSTIVIITLYIIFLRLIFSKRKAEDPPNQTVILSMKRDVVSFVISSIVIIGVGIYLPVVGDEIALGMGWKHSFVGVIFLAIVTSFPELVVCITAAKIGAFDMLLGNITGSNMFNVAIVFFIDLFYLKGNILSAVSSHNGLVGIIALLMSGMVLLVVMGAMPRRFFKRFSLINILIISLYILGLIIIY